MYKLFFLTVLTIILINCTSNKENAVNEYIKVVWPTSGNDIYRIYNNKILLEKTFDAHGRIELEKEYKEIVKDSFQVSIIENLYNSTLTNIASQRFSGIDTIYVEPNKKYIFSDKYHLLEDVLSMDLRIKNMGNVISGDTTIYKLEKDVIESKFPRKDFFYGDENELKTMKIYVVNKLILCIEYNTFEMKEVRGKRCIFEYNKNKMLTAIKREDLASHFKDTLLVINEHTDRTK